MKIVVDINHPAHVHYFKNFIWEMEKRGHEILVTASEKDISYTLLDHYGLSYVKIGNYGRSLIQKSVNIPLLDLKMYQAVKSFKPDIFVGFGSIRAAHVARILGKPYVALDDTEHARWGHMLYVPFADAILTPACFRKSFGDKQVRFNGYAELQYLHPNRFTPDPAVLAELDLTSEDIFIVVRLVAWEASHDVGQHGIKDSIQLVKALERYGRVLITSESALPPGLENYRIRVSPEKLHDLLYYATLYVGEGGTTASEAALLGTHAIHISTTAKHCGVFDDLNRYGLLWTSENDEETLSIASELLETPGIREIGKHKRTDLIGEKIDVTEFVIGIIEQYSDSNKKERPLVQGSPGSE